MAARQLQAWGAGDRDFRIAYDWRDMDEIAPSLPLSLIAAEDQDFARHGGFDFEAIEKARASNARGGRMRGASKLSQQDAKQLFLSSEERRVGGESVSKCSVRGSRDHQKQKFLDQLPT